MHKICAGCRDLTLYVAPFDTRPHLRQLHGRMVECLADRNSSVCEAAASTFRQLALASNNPLNTVLNPLLELGIAHSEV